MLAQLYGKDVAKCKRNIKKKEKVLHELEHQNLLDDTQIRLDFHVQVDP